jgi:acyl carrier protein phosphodiesterase
MNYLAHALLSGTNESILCGNFMGDFYKGTQWSHLPSGFQTGIRLHRYIDSITDAHTLVSHWKQGVKAGAGRYAGIALDIYFDHLLARNWSNHHHLVLNEFSKNTYHSLNKFAVYYPNDGIAMLEKMTASDWLSNYATQAGIATTLNNFSTRFALPVNLSSCLSDLEQTLGSTDEFEDFFAEIKLMADQFRKNFDEL